MNECLHVLLANSIDYAGVFPPAKLPLSQAVQNFVSYQTQADRWMLGRFVCPAGSLEDLQSNHDVEKLPRRCRLAVVGSAATSADEMLEQLRRDADSIRRFDDHCHDRLATDSLELKLPLDALNWPGTSALTQFFETVNRILATANLFGVRLFYELPPCDNWHEAVESVVPVIKAAASKHFPIGLKFRTGGLQPSAFPSVAWVAYFVVTCCRANIAWKATAGLHQPLRHFSHGLGAWQHGFLNLFVASVFARTHELSATEISEILEAQTIDAFDFEDDRLVCNQRTVTTDEVARARDESFISFGSCSFNEPREGLRVLGLL